MALQIRRGTDAEWEANNSNIVAGEPAITTDTERFFVGTDTGTYAEFANVTLLAPPYNSSMNYKEHDFVTYHGKMYICLEDTSGAWDSSKWEVTDINRAVVDGMYTNFESRTVSGSIVDISDGAGNVPVVDVATEIVAQQDLHGQANPYPAGGSPQVWNEEWVQYGTNQIAFKNRIPCFAGESYYVRCWSKSGTIYWYATESGATIGNTYVNANGNVITAPEGANYMRFITEVGYGTTYKNDIVVNYPSTNHDYYPWANICPITGFNTGNIIVSPTENQGDGTTYIVAWHSEAGTVYGGEVDVTKGKLTLTHEIADLGGLTWSYSSSRKYFLAGMPARKINSQMICSAFPYKGNSTDSAMANQPDMTLWGDNNGRAIKIKDSLYDDANLFKTAMNGTKLVYELDAPVEYDITPVDAIKTLLGQNYIWSNTGDITVEYRITNQNVSELRSVISTPSLERQVEPNDRPIEDIRLDTLERDVSITPSVLDVEPMEREDLTEEPIEDEPIDEPTEEQDEPLEETEDEPVEKSAEENEVEDGITD